VSEPETLEFKDSRNYDYLCDDGVWRLAYLYAECPTQLWLRFNGWSPSRLCVVSRDPSRFAGVCSLPSFVSGCVGTFTHRFFFL
jgi:hypothetical protein